MDVPERYADMYKRARHGSRASALRVFCLQCVGWSSREVKACTAPACPLYAYRLGTYEPTEIGLPARAKSAGNAEALARARGDLVTSAGER